MILWAALTVLAALAAVALAVPLVRRAEARADSRAATLAVLDDALADVDAQEARGAVSAAEADGIRTEIKRRMIAAGREPEAAARPMSAGASRASAFALAGAVAVSAVALYAFMGRPELKRAQPQPQAAAAEVNAADEAADLARRLEARLAQAPNDAEGWRLLGVARFGANAFAESAQAFTRAAQLNPDLPGVHSGRGEALAQAEGGQVTPAARAAFLEALRRDPADPRARFYLAGAKAQAGDPRGAIADWLELLRSAPEDAPWLGALRETIATTAREANLPVPREAAQQPVGPPPPPGADAIASLPPEQRAAAIRSMVDGLAARLAENPRDLEGWERLIRARAVLGDREAAERARADARRAFAGDASALARIDAA